MIKGPTTCLNAVAYRRRGNFGLVDSRPGAMSLWRSRATLLVSWAVRANAGKSVPAWVSPEDNVPLSEHERRQFEQIEAALRDGDPRFAGALRAADLRVHYRRRVIAAALGFLAGVGLLLAGVVINVIVISVAGFVVMLACALWAVSSYRRMTGRATGRTPASHGGSGHKRRAAGGRRPGTQAKPRLMERLEERWRRRAQPPDGG